MLPRVDESQPLFIVDIEFYRNYFNFLNSHLDKFLYIGLTNYFDEVF